MHSYIACSYHRMFNSANTRWEETLHSIFQVRNSELFSLFSERFGRDSLICRIDSAEKRGRRSQWWGEINVTGLLHAACFTQRQPLSRSEFLMSPQLHCHMFTPSPSPSLSLSLSLSICLFLPHSLIGVNHYSYNNLNNVGERLWPQKILFPVYCLSCTGSCEWPI